MSEVKETKKIKIQEKIELKEIEMQRILFEVIF